MGELLRLAESRNSKLDTRLANLVPHATPKIPIDEETTHSYAAIGLELKKTGRPIPLNDLWFAVLCRQHSLPLPSRDRHFDLVSGLRRLDW